MCKITRAILSTQTFGKASRNALVNWQVAPAEWEISSGDTPKIQYRKHVENNIDSVAIKGLRKRPFFTIATNVLCADLTSSRDDIDPIDRDLYLPLEISITKWSLSDGKIDADERVLSSKVWLINPGSPTSGSISKSKEHREKTHKIEFDPTNEAPNQYVEPDWTKVMKEINAFLTQDRTVYSQSLKFIRQDLGSLKWLNRNTGYKLKPINFYSLEDLYVVLVRRFNPEMITQIGQGLAVHRMSCGAITGSYEEQCEYHQLMSKEGIECNCCAKALTVSYSNSLINDVCEFGEVFIDESNSTTD